MVRTSRPTCRKCGAKILKARGIFDGFVGRVPEHCWKCGEKISSEELQQLQNFESFQCCLFLIVLVVAFVTMMAIYFVSRS